MSKFGKTISSNPGRDIGLIGPVEKTTKPEFCTKKYCTNLLQMDKKEILVNKLVSVIFKASSL